MGLTTSVGLGIAMCRPELNVVVLDDDGSLLMNLGSPTTMARSQPKNLIHIIFDNESLLSIGGFPTATATGSDLEKMAGAAGIPRSRTVSALEEFTQVFHDALSANELTTLVAKVEGKSTFAALPDLHMLENRFEFQRHLRSLSNRNGTRRH
jgi:sulfopyruvate decarboxylase subunit beta